MEPLMNAPQWFLEREDSVELLGLLKITYRDPIEKLNKFTYSTGKRYLVIFEILIGAYIRTFSNLANIKKNKFILIRCAYDTQNDQYISI